MMIGHGGFAVQVVDKKEMAEVFVKKQADKVVNAVQGLRDSSLG